jgi:hypothetical protein
MKKTCTVVSGLILTLLVQGHAQAPGGAVPAGPSAPPAQDPACVAARWDITQTVAALVTESARPRLPGDSTLMGVGRPIGGLNAELLCVFRIQPLPAKLHRLASHDTADGISA